MGVIEKYVETAIIMSLTIDVTEQDIKENDMSHQIFIVF